MSILKPLLQELDASIGLPDYQGQIDTALAGLRFFRLTEAVPRTPLLYEAGLVIIGQGHKVLYLGDRQFQYGEDNYLIVSVSVPFECEAHASPEEPLLGISLDIDLPRLRELVSSLADELPVARLEGGSIPRGVEPAPLDAPMIDAAARLVRCLRSPLDTRVLGPAIVDELVYRALLGPHGPSLYALTQHQSPSARVARALATVHQRYADTLSVDALAREAGMSASAFHRAFRAVTGETPIQYIKKIRLNKAKRLLVHDGLAVSAAAYQVGYESASQFSREFKRYFDAPPSEAARIGYANLREQSWS